MGNISIFGKKSEEELTNLDKLIKLIKQDSLNHTDMIEVVNEVSKNPSRNFFDTEEEFIMFVTTILKNNNLNNRDFKKLYDDARELYIKFKTSGYDYSSAFICLFYPNGLYEKDMVSIELMAAFEVVENFYSVMSMISSNVIANNNLEETKRLIISLAAFTPNDLELRQMIAYFLSSSLHVGDYKEAVTDFIEVAKKRAGIYDDLDDKYLANMELLVKKSMSAIDSFKEEEKEMHELMNSIRVVKFDAERKNKQFEDAMERFDEDLKNHVDRYIRELQSAYADIYSKLLNDSREFKNDIQSHAKSIAFEAATEAVSKMQMQANELEAVKSRYENYTVKSKEELDEIRNAAREEVKNGLNAMSELLKNTEGVDFEKLSELLKSSEIQTQAKEIIVPTSGVITTQEGVIYNKKDESPIPDVIPCLDLAIEARKRMNMVLDKKKRMEANGIVYNETIDDILYMIITRKIPYIYGPSGAGKNYFIQQISELLDLPYINCGYFNEEYEITGGITASGAYSPSNLYKCYRNGYLALLNEFDNGNSQANVKLNDFMDEEIKQYNFPGVDFVKRHDNFRIVCTGNTTGDGATSAHNARQKFDEATQQRLKFIRFDFDPNVEKSIIGKNKGWYEFILLFRRAINSYCETNNIDQQGNITTRDIRDIAGYLNDGVISEDKILLYEFIEAKHLDYLTYINDFMREKNPNGEAGKLVKKFGELIKCNGEYRRK